MIQRIQTLYLVLSIVCLILLTTTFHVYQIDGGKTGTMSICGYHFSGGGFEFFPLFILPLLLILLELITVFLYKKLKVQIKLGSMTLVCFLLGLVFLIAWPFVVAGSHTDMAEGFKLMPHVGFYLYCVALIFAFLAQRGIKKDKNLLDSLNRLR